MFLDIGFNNFSTFLNWLHNCFTTLFSYFISWFGILFNNSLIKYSLMIGIFLFVIDYYFNVLDFIPDFLILHKHNAEVHDMANNIRTSASNSFRDISGGSYNAVYDKNGNTRSLKVSYYGNHSRRGGYRK